MWRSDPIKDERLTAWTTQEEEIVKMLYPQAPQREIMQALPYKTPGQIKKAAWERGIKRDYRHIDQTERFYWTVCDADLQAVAHYAGTTKERDYLYREINRMASETKRGSLTALWFLPLDMISFSHALCVTSENESGLPRTLASWL